MMTVTPPPQADTRPQRHDLHAMEQQQVAQGAMTYTNLEGLIRDIEWEPDWRTSADKNAAYYDGYQKTEEQKRLEQEGQPVAVVNLIFRTVNAMLGNEARARTGPKLTADSEEEFGEVADALQVKLTSEARETRADIAISEAYASQCKAGVGWVEVSRRSELLEDSRYRVRPVHRNEIWWDWRAKELDLNDARWLVRKQWHDLDDLEAVLPEWRDIFRYYGASWNNMTFQAAIHASDLTRQVEDERKSFKVRADEWLNTSRKRIMSFEVWYRRIVPAVALMLADGTTREFNPRNPLHAEAVSRGQAKLQKTWKRQLRMALFIGPHRLMDVATPRKRFPYVPFWAFRDDQDRSPYSIVTGMRYPQDEYNARRSRLMWLLQAAQVIADDDALAAKWNNLADVAREIRRPDGVIVTNSQRRNSNGLAVNRFLEMPREQFEVMTDARNLIMEQSGVSAAMMGDKVPGVTSGVAFGSLVSQSNVAVGDHDDNYRLGRKLVYENLLDLIVEDSQIPNMKVLVGAGTKQRAVILNTQDEQGMPKNMVAAAAVKTALDEAPNSPAYKSMQQQQLMQALQVAGNDPIARAVLLPAYLESSDLPNRESDARWLRQQSGVPMPGDREGQRAADEQRAQQQAKQSQMAEANAMAEIRDKTTKADANAAAADLDRARATEIGLRATHPAANDPAQDAINEAMSR